MNGFARKNPAFSLCGLNCLLCPMLLGGYCGGCGNGNQSCGIARCSIHRRNAEQGRVEYCTECSEYPCERYRRIDEYDSFITHKRRKLDLAKAQQMGADAYTLELLEKKKCLDYFLSFCNDGRRKTLFLLAANLLELSDLQGVMEEVCGEKARDLPTVKERAAYVAGAFQKIAESRNILLKLRKKQG